MGLSSATRIRARHRSSGSLEPFADSARTAGSAGGAPGRARARSTVNQNSVPSPTSLRTPILPPMASTSCFEIASPSPLPPWTREIEESICENFAKRRSTLSPGMPAPVSRTVNRSEVGLPESRSGSTRRSTRPESVNLIALPTMLMMTCRRRPGSPLTSTATPAATSQPSASPFSAARGVIIASMSSVKSRRSNPMDSSSSLPASILEMSRMSLTSASRNSPLVRALSA